MDLKPDPSPDVPDDALRGVLARLRERYPSTTFVCGASVLDRLLTLAPAGMRFVPRKETS